MEKLGISKIYLEQVFSLLKRARLVNSIKGSQGGYQLSRAPRAITAYDILSAIELSLMEEAAPASPEKMPELDRALGGGFLFAQLDELPVIGGILLHFVLDGLEGCLGALNVTLDLLAAAVAVRLGLFLRLFLAHGAFDRLEHVFEHESHK